MPSLAPVLLFVYERPQHTQKTLEALAKNPLAYQSELYVFADGLKPNASAKNEADWQEVQNIIHQDWPFDKVKIIQRKENWGLAKNICEGIQEVLNTADQVIIVEDDVISSPGFLSYMNQALTLYSEESKVMHISAYTVPFSLKSAEKDRLASTFFYSQSSCWGWGTWKRAWKHFQSDAPYLLDQIKKRGQLSAFDLEGAMNFSEHLIANIENKIHTWAIKWQASIFLQGGLCLHPQQSLCRNIGADGSGVHAIQEDYLEHQPIVDHIQVQKIPLEEDKVYKEKVRQFYLQRAKKFQKKHRKEILKTHLKSFIPGLAYLLKLKNRLFEESTP